MTAVSRRQPMTAHDHRLYRAIGTALRQAREQAGLTQDEVGQRLGLTRGMVSMLEHGRRRILVEHLVDIAGICGVSARRLLPPEDAASEPPR